MRTLDFEKVQEHFGETGHWQADSVPLMQVSVFVMCGGGFLGRLAAEQPADFYIDSRCGKLPYGRREIMQAVKVLTTAAQAFGLDPHNMPRMPLLHNLGVF